MSELLVKPAEAKAVSSSDKPGARLKAARMRAGVSFEAMAKELYLTADKLQALENDAYDSLPTIIFVQGYIRKYAKAVGMSGDELIESLNKQLGVNPVAEDHMGATLGAKPKRSAPPKWLMPVSVFGVGVAILLIVLWQSFGDEQPEQQTPNINEQLISEKAASLAQQLDAAATDAPVQEAEASVNEQAEQESQAAAVTGTSSQQVFSDTIAADRLQMVFVEDCWVRVTDGTGTVIHAALQTPNLPLQLVGQRPFQIMLGNARAASVLFNDQPVVIDPLPGRTTVQLEVGK